MINKLKEEYNEIYFTRGNINKPSIDSFTCKGQTLNLGKNFEQLFNKIAKIMNIDYIIYCEPSKFGKYIRTKNNNIELESLINNKKIQELREERIKILKEYDNNKNRYEAYIIAYEPYFNCLKNLTDAYFDSIIAFLSLEA